MSNFIYIGKVSNTHGIKGEIRILSDFLRKDLVFKKDFKLYFGKDRECEIINSYRKHKEYDMVTLKNIDNINDVLKYKGQKVFVNRDELETKNDYIINDLIGFSVVEDKKVLGIISDFMYNNGNILLCIEGEKNFYIPYNDAFIKNVSLDLKIVEVENAKGLIL